MIDALLTVSDQKEALSLIYARAVAARAGYVTEVLSPDRDSVDLCIRAGGRIRPLLDLQLKATVNLKRPGDGFLHFPLGIKNYNDLRIESLILRLLVVLDLPKEEQRWMTITQDELILRHRAYWLNLQGYEETANQSSVTVRIPEENLFNVESLRTLMEQSRTGGSR